MLLLLPPLCSSLWFYIKKRSLDTEGDGKPLLIFGKNFYCSLVSFMKILLQDAGGDVGSLKNFKRAVPFKNNWASITIHRTLSVRLPGCKNKRYIFITMSTQIVDNFHDCRKDISTHKSCVMCNKVLECGCIHHPDLWETSAGVWKGWRSGQWWDKQLRYRGVTDARVATLLLKTGATTSGISFHYFHPFR